MKERKTTVLFVDNDPDFLDTRSEALTKTGFKVIKATSFEEAEQILHERWVHLAIIDLRLRDERDERDVSGLTLAKQEAYYSIPKIILTKYPRFKHVREALGPALDGLPPAVDYLDKKEGPAEMLQTVERVLDEFVRIDLDLFVRWGNRQHSFSLLANLIEPGVDRAYISDRADELEDLFRRLFYQSNQITLGRFLFQQEGRVVIEVFTYSEGQERQFVVSCGCRAVLREENNRHERFAPKGIGEGSTIKIKSAETTHFAASTYSLTGAIPEETVTFADFFHSNSIEVITVNLDYLFQTTLTPWYETGRFRNEERSLADFAVGWPGLSKAATLSPAVLEPRLESLCKECLSAGSVQLGYSPHQLTLHLPGRTSLSYPNPLSCLSETRLALDAPLLCGTVHGRLNGDSILVDRQGRTWLIDFSHTGQGPLLRDFVSLESAIKLELLSTTNVQTRYELEKRLATHSRLDAEIDVTDLEAEAQKALRAIQCIRHHASSVIGNDLESYLGGLLFCALCYLAAYDSTVRHTRQELTPYLHSLLSAAILCQRLAPAPRQDVPAQALNSLWIDASNKEVWVEGRKVALSSQEFDLLKYLCDHQNKLCSRSDIAQHVFEVSYGPDTSEREKKSLEESRLNSTMSRLRRKIEPNPSHPKYIIATRGEGYRLELRD